MMTKKKKRQPKVAKLRPLMKTPKGGRFTIKQIRAALKAVEKERQVRESNEKQLPALAKR